MKRKHQPFLLFLIILKLIIPYFLQNPVYEPHRDEFLYLAEGNHLSTGFMEVPPMLSIFSYLTHVLGDGIFWIKLWPSLFGAATFYIAGRLVVSLGGNRFALFLLFLSFLFTGYLRVFFLFMPNAPEIFFFTMLAFSIICYIQTAQNKWLYVFGISAGLGMLSKYSVLFYLTGIGTALLLTPYRKVFRNKHFWLGSLVGFLIFLPNLIWQYNHHFPVVYHMRTLQRTQLQYVSPADFLKDQLIDFLPCFFIWISGLWYVLISRSDTRFRLVGYAYIVVVILLLAGHGKGYYALGAYPVLFAFGAYKLAAVTAVTRKGWRMLFVGVPIVLGVLFLPVGLPLLIPSRLEILYQQMGVKKLGLLQWEDHENHPLPQDFADMLGWREMAEKVAQAYYHLPPEERKNTLLFCNNYGTAGAVNYYGKQYHLPEAYSDNASFLYWLPNRVAFQNIILVTEDSDELQKDYLKNFKTAYVADSVTTRYARERGDLIVVEIGASERMQQYFKQKIANDKAELMPSFVGMK